MKTTKSYFKIIAFIHLETIKKANKHGVKIKFTDSSTHLLTFVLGVSNLRNEMNEHAADKDCIALWVPRSLKRRVKKAAVSRKMTITEYVEWVFQRETKDVELNEHNYQEIAEEVRKAELRRDDRRKRKPDQRLRSKGA